MRFLMSILILLATATTSSAALPELTGAAFQNQSNPYDVDNNKLIQPRDALLIINRLQVEDEVIPLAIQAVPLATTTPHFFIDPSGNNITSPFDALLIINELLVNGAYQTPEPGSIVAAGIGAAMLAGFALTRRLRRRRLAAC